MDAFSFQQEKKYFQTRIAALPALVGKGSKDLGENSFPAAKESPEKLSAALPFALDLFLPQRSRGWLSAEMGATVFQNVFLRRFCNFFLF